MAKVRIVATKEDVVQAESGGGDFVVPKDGWYILQCAEANPGFSKDDDGNEDESRPKIELVFQIVGEGVEEAKPTANYGNVWDYITFGEAAGWKRAQFLKAFGFSETGEFDGDIDTDDCISMKVLARLRQQKGRTKDDAPRAKVAKLLPYGADPSVSGGNLNDGGEAEYGGEDDSSPFDEQGETEEFIPYTQEELENEDLKKLGSIFKEEFGGDPSSLIVKNKAGKLDADATKAAVVTAILEAQSVSDGDGAEEDPF